MRSRWLTVVLTVIAVLVVEVSAGLIYIYSGSYNIAATDDLAPLSRWIFPTTTMRSIKAHSPEENPFPQPLPQHMLAEGAEHYGEMCAGCHGTPAQKASDFISKGMTPSPPDLKKVAKKMSSGEIYWILENGIKHTGMPAMSPTHPEEKIQAVAAFVKKLPGMSPQQYKSMSGGEEGHEHGEEGHEHGEAGADSSHAHGTPGHEHGGGTGESTGAASSR